MVSISVCGAEDELLVELVPPQTNDAGIGPTKGAYCFVVDVSGRHAVVKAGWGTKKGKGVWGV